jgi:hypothetical protein
MIRSRPEWWNGRHGGLKIRCLKGRVGSTPTSGTHLTRSNARAPPRLARPWPQAWPQLSDRRGAQACERGPLVAFIAVRVGRGRERHVRVTEALAHNVGPHTGREERRCATVAEVVQADRREAAAPKVAPSLAQPIRVDAAILPVSMKVVRSGLSLSSGGRRRGASRSVPRWRRHGGSPGRLPRVRHAHRRSVVREVRRGGRRRGSRRAVLEVHGSVGRSLVQWPQSGFTLPGLTIHAFKRWVNELSREQLTANEKRQAGSLVGNSRSAMRRT